MARLAVKKTYKMYVGGKFVRSESGRSLQAMGVNYPNASRKDLRDAVKEARSAFEPWKSRTPYNRAQIVYRIAEMLGAREREFAALIARETGLPIERAREEVCVAVDRCVYYCGWADKFDAVFGSVNPVSGPFFSFSVSEPMGVIGVVADEDTPLIGLVSQTIPAIVCGNSCVAIASVRYPLSALEFGEVIATSDVPGGVFNLLTGDKQELLPHLSRHMDVNAVGYRDGDAEVEREIVTLATGNLKRTRIEAKKRRAWWLSGKAQGPDWIESFVETKTVWHPVGV